MKARVAPYGPNAIAFSVHATPSPHLSARLRGFADTLHAWPAVVETVVAYVEVVVRFRETPFARLPETRTALELAWWTWCEAPHGTELATGAGGGTLHELPTAYDGPDLPDVAERCGLDVGAIVAAHSRPTYTVYALGFQPGFAFMGELPEALWLPRKDVPLPRVPAGSVAIAGHQTGVYPHASPGGWYLIGRCDAPVFDPASATLSRFAVGDRVRFIPIAR